VRLVLRYHSPADLRASEADSRDARQVGRLTRVATQYHFLGWKSIVPRDRVVQTSDGRTLMVEDNRGLDCLVPVALVPVAWFPVAWVPVAWVPVAWCGCLGAVGWCRWLWVPCGRLQPRGGLSKVGVLVGSAHLPAASARSHTSALWVVREQLRLRPRSLPRREGGGHHGGSGSLSTEAGRLSMMTHVLREVTA
jgi:hypothetical protein